MDSNRSLRTEGQDYLEKLASSSPNGFERRFAEISTRLDLGVALTCHELSLLYEAALYATLCCIAFNGLGGCGGEIAPEREINRIKLEREFMAARDEFYDSAGWKSLAAWQKTSIERIILNVCVAEDNLTW